jgi:hypothetical protein
VTLTKQSLVSLFSHMSFNSYIRLTQATESSSRMATTEACDRLWATSTIDRESSAYAYTGSRPEWRTKGSRPTVVVEETTPTEEPRPRPTTTQTPDLPPAYEDSARRYHDNWTLKFNNAFARRSFIGTNFEGYHYGISENGGSKPDSFFVCKRKSKSDGSDSIDSHCWQAIRQLQRHRAKKGRNCHCDFEWIRCGSTKRDTARLCNWRAGTTGRSVLKEMHKHDKKCSCDAFKFASNRLGL